MLKKFGKKEKGYIIVLCEYIKVIEFINNFVN